MYASRPSGGAGTRRERKRPAPDPAREPEGLTAAMTEKRMSPTPTRRPRPTPGAAARAPRRRGGPRSSTPPRRARGPPGWRSHGQSRDAPQRRLQRRETCRSSSRARTGARRCGPGALAGPARPGGPRRSAARAARSHRPWAAGWGERWERKRVWARRASTGSALGAGGGRAAAPTSAFSVLRRGRAARLCGAEGHALPPRESPFPGSTGAPRPLRGNRSSGSWALGTPVGKPQVQGHGLGCGKGLNLGQETSKMEGRMGGGCLQTNVPAPTSPRPLRRGKARDAEG